MRSGTELSQFLRVFLPTPVRYIHCYHFPFGFEGNMWSLILSVSDHCPLIDCPFLFFIFFLNVLLL